MLLKMDANNTQTNIISLTLPQCSAPISLAAVLFATIFLLCLSAVILIVLTLIKQRVRLAPNCCHGYPGIPVPMDFLIAPRHRWIYVAILGVMGVQIFFYFRQLNNFSVGSNRYLQLFIKLMVLPLATIALMTLQFAPLFACVDASFTLLGHIIGLVYSMLWYALVLTTQIGSYIQLATKCSGRLATVDGGSFVVLLFQDIPYLVVGGFIVLWYIYQVVVGIVKYIRTTLTGGGHHQFGSHIKNTLINNTPRFSDTCRDYYISHVKELFKKQVNKVITQGRATKLVNTIWNYLVPFNKYYRLPVPFLGAVAAILMILYRFSFLFATFGVTISSTGKLFFDRLIEPALNSPNPNVSETFLGSVSLSDIEDILRGVFVGIPVVVAMSPILAYITCLLILVHMIGSISKMMKKTLQQGFTEQLPGAVRRVPSSWKFVGLLIGFCFAAWGLYCIVYLLVGIVIGAFILLLRFSFTRPWVINTAIGFVVPIIWTQCLFWGQFLLCKFIFFADKDGKFVSITNRNLFNWFALLLFFYNGLAGFVQAIFRIAYSAAVGMLLLFRLDYIVIAPTFAFLDKGHKAFLGFFYFDYAYNNPVVHVFIKVLKESLYDNPSLLMKSFVSGEKYKSLEKGIIQTSKVYPRQRIRNRWLVAYTLLKNPSLQKLTGTNLKAKKPIYFYGTEENEDVADVVEKADL